METTDPTAVPTTEGENNDELKKGQTVKIDLDEDGITDVTILEVTKDRIQFEYTNWEGKQISSLTPEDFKKRSEATTRVAQALAEMDATHTAQVSSATPVNKSLMESWKDRLKRPSPTIIPLPAKHSSTPEEEAQQKQDKEIFIKELVTALQRLAVDDPAIIREWSTKLYVAGLHLQVFDAIKDRYGIVFNIPTSSMSDEVNAVIKNTIQDLATARTS
jgi:hypothetical protein